MIKTLASIAKIALLSRTTGRIKKAEQGRALVIMGNGPSLADTMRDRADLLASSDLMAVNFAANSPEFFKLKPQLYILADPHFFEGAASDPNVRRLWDNLSRVDWPMTLLVPVGRKPLLSCASPRRQEESGKSARSYISVEHFNMTPVEGLAWLQDFAFRNGLGMPRPRNVLIPAIMSALRKEYRTVYLAGADHSWSKTLWVDDRNRVVTVQPHFYPDNEEERERVTQTYAGIRLHQIYESFSIAFRSYHLIAAYVERLNARHGASDGQSPVRIINITPGSFIDAFPRG